jgi:AraC family transcriptional regulator, L-rhamnose operon transcriptional activator RhaR
MSSSPYEKLAWDRHFRRGHAIQALFQPRQLEYPVHDHQFIEVMVVVGGSCLHRTVLGPGRLQRGDAFLFRPGAWHGFHNCRSLAIYNCGFDLAILGRELAWMIDDPSLGRLLWALPLAAAQRGLVQMRLAAGDLAEAVRVLDALCSLTDFEYASYRADYTGLLNQLLGLLARTLPEPPRRKRAAPPQHAIQEALRLIDGDPAHPWSLPELSARLAITPPALVRRFHAVAGLPPMAYVARRRLELATGWLTNSDLSIGEIGNRVGWPDANYFTRRFRAMFGMSPTTYRHRFSAGNKATT